MEVAPIDHRNDLVVLVATGGQCPLRNSYPLPFYAPNEFLVVLVKNLLVDGLLQFATKLLVLKLGATMLGLVRVAQVVYFLPVGFVQKTSS